jgi:hypothetical protein
MRSGGLIVAILAALGCVAALALHANPALLAGLGALASLGIAVAAGASAVELDASDTLREPRHARGPSHPEPLPPDAAIPRRAVFGRLWHASLELYCPCHQSVFDVVDLARPTGGPAPRALPQLGLDVDRDGYLIARGDFVDPVGPDEWWRTV